MKYVPVAVSRVVARQILQGQKHSPTILFGAGVAGVVGTVVLACKATLKVDELLDDHTTDNARISVAAQLDPEKYSDMDAKRDKAYLFLRTSGRLVKLYGPSIALGAVSIGCLAGSHNILSKRNVALTAAYAAVEQSFNEYRGRVREELGEDKDREFKHGTIKKTIVEDDEHGPKKVKVQRVDPNGVSGYARFFDETVQGGKWSPNPEYNRIFLQAQQNYANDMLRARGHVFLNEVYDALGIERTKAGAVVGWVISESGDNYIDFGIFDGSRPAVRDFVNGHEGAILLDFNVDGVIYDKI